MGTKSYDKATDLITFSRASRGTALRKISYGSELVTNGTFDTDASGWGSSNAALSVVSQSLRVTATGISSYALQVVTTEVGKVYEFSADMLGGTASSQIRVGTGPNTSGGGGILYASGSFVFVATTTTTYITIKAGDTSGLYTDVDNISIKEVLFDQADGELTLFNHPDDIPRIEYAANGSVKGLLIEEQRTNLLTDSSNFNPNTSDWTKTFSGISVTEDNILSPSGVIDADLVNKTGSTAFLSLSSSVTSGVSYTFSFFAKAGTLPYVYLRVLSGADLDLYYFDLESGTTGASHVGGAISIEDYGSGWYRCILTTTTTATTLSTRIAPCAGDEDASGVGTCYLYGAQLEQGSFPTSYIPTSGSTATRSADIASIPVSAFGYNQKAGSVVVEFEVKAKSATDYLVTLDDGSTSNIIVSKAHTSNHNLVLSGGSVQANIDAGDIVIGDLTKIALSFAEDDFSVTIDGGSVSSDSSGTMPTGITSLGIGYGGGGAGYLQSGHIKSIQYYPRRLTNAQLQEITS